jgi:hypothetical protein
MKAFFKLRPNGTLGWPSPCLLSLGSCFLVISVLAVGTSAASGTSTWSRSSSWISAKPAETNIFETKPFDPMALAKLRIGEIVEAIKQSGRVSKEREPDNLFSTALLIQAGLRALLPPAERVGVAMPGLPNPKDPQALRKAQQNYAAVFEGGKEATKAQRDVALNAVAEGARQLQKAGYEKAASILTTWLQNQGSR